MQIYGDAAFSQPNIVLILTDDQDSELQGASHMPSVRRLLSDKGLKLLNSFVANPLCCPSRLVILEAFQFFIYHIVRK